MATVAALILALLASSCSAFLLNNTPIVATEGTKQEEAVIDIPVDDFTYETGLSTEYSNESSMVTLPATAQDVTSPGSVIPDIAKENVKPAEETSESTEKPHEYSRFAQLLILALPLSFITAALVHVKLSHIWKQRQFASLFARKDQDASDQLLQLTELTVDPDREVKSRSC